MLRAKEGILYDTYPWPYCMPGFANWEEDDRTGTYTLISDQALCVVKYSTSYCAWKIFELTGKWLERNVNTGRMDARNWAKLLSQNGYFLQTKKPLSGHYYVGIDEKAEPWGEVVWLEDVHSPHTNRVLVSTYRDKKYYLSHVETEAYTWVKID